MNAIAQDIQTHWHVIRPIFVIHTEDDYDMAVERMNNLIDEVGTDEHHPLYDLLDILGTMIHGYEKKHYPIPESNGPEMLGFFMD
ncbi:MAG: transcriptional regulator, partial [Gammaproteobacteria bacterium]|nr:transcriptional regulator [Gammaproteobacteria bacterium]